MNEKHLHNWIVAALRRASYRFGPRYKTKAAAKVGYNQYVCNECKQVFASKEVQLDHIIPVVPVEGWDSWDGFITRLFCSQDGWQLLCKRKGGCHSRKTLAENEARRYYRSGGTGSWDISMLVPKASKSRRKASGTSSDSGKTRRKQKRKK